MGKCLDITKEKCILIYRAIGDLVSLGLAGGVMLVWILFLHAFATAPVGGFNGMFFLIPLVISVIFAMALAIITKFKLNNDPFQWIEEPDAVEENKNE
jgi:hypothetical protein